MGLGESAIYRLVKATNPCNPLELRIADSRYAKEKAL